MPIKIYACYATLENSPRKMEPVKTVHQITTHPTLDQTAATLALAVWKPIPKELRAPCAKLEPIQRTMEPANNVDQINSPHYQDPAPATSAQQVLKTTPIKQAAFSARLVAIHQMPMLDALTVNLD